MAFDQIDKICRRVTLQSRFGKMRVGRYEVFGRNIEICEITATATRNENFPTGLGSMIQ